MRLDYLLAFIPIALGLAWLDADPLVVFGASAVAIVPLAGLMGRATENLAHYLGDTLGSLLNASLGNAPELIIAIFALHKGLYMVVKASITGSVIANLLLTTGLAMFVGGLRRERQQFNLEGAKINVSLLCIAVFGLVIPTLHRHLSASATEYMSIECAVVLFGVYVASLVFTLKTHRHLFQARPSSAGSASGGYSANSISGDAAPEEKLWSKRRATIVLVCVTIALAVMSETLTGALEPATESIGLTPVFAGVIVLAMLGNMAEMMNAVRFARKDKMELAFGMAVGASTQVALLVAPLLVFFGFVLGQPMDLVFTPFEVAAVSVAVLIVARVTGDGESNWMEGLMLVAVYALLAVGFFYLK